ncbi:MAG: hypothetical protein ABI992_11370 [Chthoniobacterales bacterium]
MSAPSAGSFVVCATQDDAALPTLLLELKAGGSVLAKGNSALTAKIRNNL